MSERHLFKYSQKSRAELVEFLKSVGVDDLSDRAVDSFEESVDETGHIEVAGRYTASGSPATTVLSC